MDIFSGTRYTVSTDNNTAMTTIPLETTDCEIAIPSDYN